MLKPHDVRRPGRTPARETGAAPRGAGPATGHGADFTASPQEPSSLIRRYRPREAPIRSIPTAADFRYCVDDPHPQLSPRKPPTPRQPRDRARSTQFADVRETGLAGHDGSVQFAAGYVGRTSKRNHRGSPVGSTGVQNCVVKAHVGPRHLACGASSSAWRHARRCEPRSLVRVGSLPSRPVSAFVGIQEPAPNRARREGRRRCLVVECDSDGRVRVAHQHGGNSPRCPPRGLIGPGATPDAAVRFRYGCGRRAWR